MSGYYGGVMDLELEGNPDLSQYPNLKALGLSSLNITSVDFLKTIPNPKKLEYLNVSDNNILPTDISVFSELGFVNLLSLQIGNAGNTELEPDKEYNKKQKYNRFYGSLKAYQPLTKLRSICIEATDIFEGLEYLPLSLNIRQHGKDGLYSWGLFQCFPHSTNAKCKVIQDQLRKYDYDLEAWQLAHPAQMFRAKPELFALEDSKEKWLNALHNKIEKTQQKLKEIKNDPDKIKKIKRLNTKLGELNAVKQLLDERSIFEDSLNQGVRWYDKFKEDKFIQTEPAKTQDQQTQTEEQAEYEMPGSWPKKK